MKVTIEPPELFEYGIHNEASNIRAHVAPLANCVFVFPTISARRFIEENKKSLRKVSGFQDGVIGKTSDGYLISPSSIEYMRVIKIKPDRFVGFSESLSTPEKGDRAVAIVEALLKAGRFPLWFEGEFAMDLETQLKGSDISASGKWSIEVKCDFRASEQPGKPDARCTGNLFLQTAERNPLRRF